MNTVRKIQITITITAIIIAVTHIIWPSLNIDSITMTLVIVAVIPWLAPLFKSVELPGGLKFEFQEQLERVKKEAKAAWLISNKFSSNKNYTFLEFAESNPTLALASLRMEIEKSLRILAENKDIEIKWHQGISFLMRDLHEKGVLTDKEKSALADMLGTLNRAVHGEELDYRATQWVIDIGPQILSTINNKIN